MAYRGRLIWPFVAEIAQIDTAATQTGPPNPGYDAEFREPVRVPDLTERGSHSARREKASIFIQCQVRTPEDKKQTMAGAGDLSATAVTLVFHFSDLERLGLVDGTTKEPNLRVNDRLVAITRRNGDKVRTFANPPGMFAAHLRESGWGLSNLSRNLLVVDFVDREQGVR